MFLVQITLSVVVFDVLPEARTGGWAVRLLKVFELWAKNRNAIEVALGVNSGGKFCERQFMIKSIKAVLLKLFVHYPIPRLHPSFSVLVPIFFWNLVILGPIAICAYFDAPRVSMDQLPQRTEVGRLAKDVQIQAFIIEDSGEVLRLTTHFGYILGAGKQVYFPEFEGKRVTVSFAQVKIFLRSIWVVKTIRSDDGVQRAYSELSTFYTKAIVSDLALLGFVIAILVGVFTVRVKAQIAQN